MYTAPQKTAETLDFPRGHCLREAGAGGSNPLTPTIFPRYLAARRTVVGWCNGTTDWPDPDEKPKDWYCERCALVVPLGERCRVCGAERGKP